MVIVAAVGLEQQSEHAPLCRSGRPHLAGRRADKQEPAAIEQFASQLGADAQKIRGAVLTSADTAPCRDQPNCGPHNAQSEATLANPGFLPLRKPAIRSGADAGTLIRSVLLAAVFLLLWISFRPFENLSVAPEMTNAGNLINQIGYSLLFLLLAAWCLNHDPSRLLVLVRPVLIITLLWFALCVLTSWEPSLSARRFAFTLVTMGWRRWRCCCQRMFGTSAMSWPWLC